MKAFIATVDSVIGGAVRDVWVERGDEVSGTTRRADSTNAVFMDVTAAKSWVLPEANTDVLLYTIAQDTPKSILDVFDVNVVSTFNWLDYVANSGRVKPGGTIAVLSSQFGSVGEVINAQAPWYRMSKAALNMGLAVLNQRWSKYRWLALHPGLVDTPMTKGLRYSHDKLTPRQSAERLVTLIDSNVGFGFYDAPTGRKIPW